jgi:hypothetical protein
MLPEVGAVNDRDLINVLVYWHLDQQISHTVSQSYILTITVHIVITKKEKKWWFGRIIKSKIKCKPEHESLAQIYITLLWSCSGNTTVNPLTTK